MLREFASAVLGPDHEVLQAARESLRAQMGEAAVIATAMVAADFSLVDRAANAIGIFVEPMVLKPSEDFRDAFGLNHYRSARPTLGATA
ncbi:MAG: hypothetical protein AAF384_15950 [Pseudomonadota bacterium]